MTGKKALLRATSSDLLGYNAAMNESSLKTDTTICYLHHDLCLWNQLKQLPGVYLRGSMEVHPLVFSWDQARATHLQTGAA